jgi:hypothetical protein
LTRCGESGDLPFDYGRLDTTDARRLSRTIDVSHRCLLMVVHRNITVDDLASEKLGKLDVRDEVKSASEHIALDGGTCSEMLDRHAP